MNPFTQPFDIRRGDWSEEEKIQLAFQIFSQRNQRSGYRQSAAQVLFEHLAGFQPDWEHLPLPPGRTVSDCKMLYSSSSRQSSGPATAPSAGPSPGSYSGFPPVGGSSGSGVTSRKRSAPSDTLTPVIGRPLAPKQPHSYPSEPGPKSSITGQYPISPMVEPSARLAEPRKKRGRPTKQEAEERRRLVEERQQQKMRMQAAQPNQYAQSPGHYVSPFGPPLQPYPQPTIPGPPREGTPLAAAASPMPVPPPTIPPPIQTPQTHPPEDQHSSGSSGKRRRMRPPRLSTSEGEPTVPPPTFAIPATQTATGAYGSPPTSGSARDSRPPNFAGASILATVPPDQEVPARDDTEDNRPQNPRSRPWEFIEKPEP